MQAKIYDIIYITINSRLYNVEGLSILTHATTRIPFSSSLAYRGSRTRQKLLLKIPDT